MHIHIFACRVMTRELSYYAARSPHTVDITWMPQGLHDTPEKLRTLLQQAMDDLYTQRENGMLKAFPDVMALGYGLCSNGVVGLKTRDVPLVVPRTDDCIALFLGSQERYRQLFATHSGAYWLNNGWIETAFVPVSERLDELRASYVEKYGEDNADFLMEQDMLWAQKYSTCAFITSPVYHNPEYPCLARRVAAENGWRYEELAGDARLIRRLAEGDWDEREFCICPPWHRLEADYDGGKLRTVPLSSRQEAFRG